MEGNELADERFNLTNLFNIYKQAIDETKNFIFELNIGKGRFLFMNFFSEEDETSKDNLFIFMRNTNTFISEKLYGNHFKGDFFIYLNESLKVKVIKELQLREGDGTFSFRSFMEQVNDKIPQHISPEQKVKLMQGNKEIIIQTGAIDEADKIYFGWVKKLSVGTPRDKTLRKLYMYTENNPIDIELFIKLLKKMNYTAVWLKAKPDKIFNIQDWINRST